MPDEPNRPLPSSTTELTPDDYRVIRAALILAETAHIREGNYDAAEAVHLVQAKLPI